MAEFEKVEKRHGGKRKGSGRKPLAGKDALDAMKAQIEKHGTQVVAVQIEGKLVKKTRTLHLLDRLFKDGISGITPATKEYFDRTTGKAPQPLEGVRGKPILISSEE